MKKVLIAVSVCIIIVSFFVLYKNASSPTKEEKWTDVQKEVTVTQKSATSTEKQKTGSLLPVENWVTYTNTDIGFSFKYPKDAFTRISIGIHDAEKGKWLGGYLEINSKQGINIMAITKDFMWRKGFDAPITYGFKKVNNMYVSNTRNDSVGSSLIPNDIWQTNNVGDALVFYDKETNQIIIFVNTQDESFPGISFYMMSEDIDGTISEEEIRLLRTIISTYSVI
jgi:hypothetical protein